MTEPENTEVAETVEPNEAAAEVNEDATDEVSDEQ